MSTYTISRKAASELLKVSIRTVDRYVKSKKLSTREIDGRVWLSREGIAALKEGRRHVDRVDNVDMSTVYVSTLDKVDKVDKKIVHIVHPVSTPKKTKKPNKPTNQIYEKLYQEAKNDLKQKQDRLEIANYRAGQLENQLKHSIPLLDYHQKTDKISRDLKDSQSLIIKLLFEIKYQRVLKWIFIILFLAILSSQPLWFLL